MHLNPTMNIFLSRLETSSCATIQGCSLHLMHTVLTLMLLATTEEQMVTNRFACDMVIASTFDLHTASSLKNIH